jgi:hypothetical protein
MRIRHRLLILPLIALTSLAACQQDDSAESADAAAEPGAKPAADADGAMRTSHTVDVIARDFLFEVPEQIPSGWTTFRFENAGAQEHFMALTRMPEGLTVDDYKNDVVVGAFGAAMGPYAAGEVDLPSALETLGGLLPEWFGQLVNTGGPGLVSPGGVAITTVELDPGYYVLECYVKTPDGRFHVDLGMLTGMVVTDAPSGATAPDSDFDVTLANYVIDAPDVVGAGKHTVRVRFLEDPEGLLKHDVHLIRLADDVTIADVVPWMDWVDGMISPAPAEFIGGAEQMPAGGVQYMTLDLEPGSYAWISEAYSPQGMVKGFVVE